MVQAPIRVLLADDTPDIRMLLRASLEMDGRFEVVGEAADGREAIDMAMAELPDVVLLDLAMPVMDGLQAIGPIVEGSPRSKIVILSGFDSAEMAPEALDRGAHAYIEKGLAGHQVIDTLVSVVGSPAREPVAVHESAAVLAPDPGPGGGSASDRGPEGPAGPPATPDGQVGEVLAAVVHELMTPLTVIQGFSETLSQRLDVLTTDTIRDIAESISRNAEQMARLIMSFANAQRMEVTRSDLDTESVDLGSFVRETVADLAHVTTGREVHLDVIDGVRTTLDRTRIRQVLHNLITNAVRYTPEGSPIDIGMARRDDVVEVWVADQGPGIPSDDAEIVFRKFTRADPRTEGAGLGLYIARTIARAHGGDVTLTASPSGGARFALILSARD